MQPGTRLTLQFVAVGLVLAGVAALIGSFGDSVEGGAAVVVAIVPLLITLFGGGTVGWWVSTRGGGLSLLGGLIGVFGLAYSTSLLPELKQPLSSFRLLAYSFLIGSLVGGAAGSMKREIERQRANRVQGPGR